MVESAYPSFLSYQANSKILPLMSVVSDVAPAARFSPRVSTSAKVSTSLPGLVDALPGKASRLPWHLLVRLLANLKPTYEFSERVETCYNS
jgi:hypothetical protein